MEKTAQRKADRDTGNDQAAVQKARQGRGRGQGKKPKLILIEPGASGKHIYSRLKLPRLGAVLLGSMARNLGWDVRVYVEDLAAVDYCDALTADLVGISTITSTANRAYAMAEAIRDYGVPVVMGGPHVTFLAEEALAYCDYVVRGEGEAALAALLEAVQKNGEGLDRVPNLSYRDQGGAIRHNERAEAVIDLDALPYPDFDLIAGWNQVKSFSSRRIRPIQTSRGCPYGCKFCSVVGMFGRRMRYRSVENVIGELRRHADPGGHVFFYDDNLTADRDWVKKLMREGLNDRRLCAGWSAQVRTDAARDPELLGMMKRARCSNVYVGIESVNPAALEEMNKKQDVGDIEEAVRSFNRSGIDVHGMFVLGFDSDTPKTLDATIRFALKSGILSAQFLILTPLPGTPLFEQMKTDGRLTGTDWSHYDAHHVVFRPLNVSTWDLQRAQIAGHRRFYSIRRTLLQLGAGAVSGSEIYIYARKLNMDWIRSNRLYLKALNMAERARGLKIRFDFELDLSEIRMQVQAAALSLA